MTCCFRYLGLTQRLPVTSYVKMIDIWMLFSLLVPFIEVMIMIWMESIRIQMRQACSFSHGSIVSPLTVSPLSGEKRLNIKMTRQYNFFLGTKIFRHGNGN